VVGSTRRLSRAALGGSGGLLALLLACSAPAARSAAPAAPASQSSAAAPAATAAPAAAAAPAQASPPAPATVRVGVLNSIGDAAFTIGMDEGYYAEQGITVETITFDSAARMIAPLSQGQLDTGQGVIGAGAMNAVARGVEIRGIAGASGSPPGHGNSAFIVRKDLVDQIKSPADLRGRRLGLTATGTGVEVLWAELLKRGGLTPDDVEFVQLNFSEQVTALGNAALDVASPSEPTATLAVDRGFGQVWMRSDEIIPNHLTSFIWAGPQFVANTDVAERFMVAALKAVRLYNDAFFKNIPTAREEVIPIFIKYTPVKDRELYDRMVFQGFDPDGRIDRAIVQHDMDYYVATGQLPAPVDMDKLIDMRFADHAVQVLGPYPR